MKADTAIYRDIDGDDDLTFVTSTWSANYKNAHTAGIIASEKWPDVMHEQIRNLIARPGVRTLVACEHPDFLYGFICAEPAAVVPIVHYCYVKAPFRSTWDGRRRSGPKLATGLFRAAGIDPNAYFLFSCRTAIVSKLRDIGKIPRARFVPAAARYANYDPRKQYEEST